MLPNTISVIPENEEVNFVSKVVISGLCRERLAFNYGWLASAGKYNTGRYRLVREKRSKMLAEKKKNAGTLSDPAEKGLQVGIVADL